MDNVTAGVACGTGAAVFWAAGFVAARHGIDAGFSPADLTIHRFAWAGLALLPVVSRRGPFGLSGVGVARGALLTVLGGPGLALLSYGGFLLVPLGHGAVIQPSSAALFGLLMAWLALKETVPLRRALGAVVIVAGLVVIGGEAIATIGGTGIVGDLMFALAGCCFAGFATLLRLWGIVPLRAAAIVSAMALCGLPLHAVWFGFGPMFAIGLAENAIQALVQGILAGPGAIYLFARSVSLLGAGRAAVFPSLVPGFTLLIGFVALGEVPSLPQLLGFVVVIAGFRLTQKG